MSLRNGVRAIGLSLGAWMLCLGALAAQEPLPTPTEEPPVALFLEVEGAGTFNKHFATAEHACSTCDARCDACKSSCAKCEASTSCAAAQPVTAHFTPFGISSLRHSMGLDDQWGIKNLELVWYGQPAVSTSGEFGINAYCTGVSAEAGLLGCLTPWCENCHECGHLTVFCSEPACAGQTALEPGEPAEVLLEIRNRVGMTPLTGTAYAPMDSTTCAKEQNAFVAGVRESAETCVATDLDPELEALFSSSEAPAPPASCPSPADVQKPSAELVPLLRLVSRNLEESANALEDAELYFRADQLRQMANELRLEARTAGGAWSLEPLGGIPRKPATIAPAPDLSRENEELRAELDRLRESLRASHDNAGVKAR